jgi:hypothetical protein
MASAPPSTVVSPGGPESGAEPEDEAPHAVAAAAPTNVTAKYATYAT